MKIVGAFFDMINEFYKYRNLKVIEVLRPHFPTVNLRNQKLEKTGKQNGKCAIIMSDYLPNGEVRIFM